MSTDIGCIIGQFSSRTCERGTKGCDVRHGDARECFSTKDGHWQDRADLVAENAKLRAEVDFANERMHAAQNERASMSDPNAKLRTLRDRLIAKRDALRVGMRMDAAQETARERHCRAWSNGLNEACREIDFMLGEESSPPEPVTWWVRDAYAPLNHEPLPELVARLHGFVGPDGRGRP